MTTLEHEPAQRQLVHRLLDWERVTSRRERYPAIGRAFPLDTLKNGRERPPSYCHYIAWRLGIWPNDDEPLVQRLEELLRCAEKLPNWEHEKSLLSDTDFAVFWSLVWQLQVAEYLHKIGRDVSWAQSGPDLSVEVGGKRWFVECYIYHKSFGLSQFLNELLKNIDPAICTDYDRCLPFSLPSDRDRKLFLDEVLSPFLDPAYLANAKERAEQEYPVVLYKHPDSSLCVYVKGSGDYMPGNNVVGHPESYLNVALKEALRAKRNSNDLKNHHPNLLAVNYLLSEDYQLAKSSRGTLPLPDNNRNIDVLTVSAAGIDERLTREKLEVVKGGRSRHVNHKNLNRIARIND